MSCVHLKKLYELCNAEQLKISGADLVHIVCTQCGKQEVCPSRLTDFSHAEESELAAADTSASPDNPPVIPDSEPSH